MAHTVYFISHADVEICATTPITEWALSVRGRKRMKALLQHSWLESTTALYCSTEQKAVHGAEMLATHLGGEYAVNVSLGENDRSSTGYLPTAEFECTADRSSIKC